MQGIYCPPGTYWVPSGESYIPWGDYNAIRQALPENLTLIWPITRNAQRTLSWQELELQREKLRGSKPPEK